MNVLPLAALWRGCSGQSWPFAALLVFCLMLNGPIVAQNASDPPTLNNVVIPPSPDAAALGEYAEVPVGLYTGVPQVSVPIWNLQGRRLSVPISLSYHASGIKVDEIASRVGLGWALQAGGTISRTVNGQADDAPNGYFNTAPLMPSNVPMGIQRVYSNTYDSTTMNLIESMTDGSYDGLPDDFNMSFPGGSARMFFDENKQPHLIPYGLMDIDRDWTNDTWTITTADGVKYYFGGPSAREENETFFGGASTSGRSSVSAWHMTRMEDPAGDIIDFIYEDEPIPACQPLPESETHYIEFQQSQHCSVPGNTRSWGTVCTQGKRIKEIVSVRGKVVFHYSPTSRIDQNGSHALERIEIQNKAGESLKQFTLYHHNWSGRMMLSEVVESNGCQAKPGQKFLYDESGTMPQPASKNRDHWGFYNGANNTTLVPRHQYANCKVIGSANREPDFNYGKLGMLSQIVHPTGGTTNFEYEANTVWDPNGKLTTQKVASASASCTNNTPNCSDAASVPEDQETFTVTHTQCGTFQLAFSNAFNPCNGIVRLTNTVTNQVLHEWNCVGSQPAIFDATLPAGTYLLQAIGGTGGDQVSVSVSYENQSAQPQNREIGGVRVKRITDHDNEDSANDMVREFVYDGASPGQSSGVLIREPHYLFEKEIVQAILSTPNPSDYVNCTFYGSNSAPKGLNGNAGGPHIGYAEVKTLYGQNGTNGYTASTFTTAINYPDHAAEFPFGPDLSRSHLRGMPLTSATFKADGTPVNSSTQSYTFRPENAHESRGYLAAYESRHPIWECPSCDILILRSYPLRSEWFYSGSTTSRQYDPNGTDFTETVTTYEYDNPDHIQVTATIVTDSEGRELITRTTYPDDIPTGAGIDPYAVAIQNLKNKFMKVTPIESTVWQQKPNQQEELLKANLTKYKVVHPGMVMPTEVWALESDQPGTAFTPASYANGTFTQDYRYRLLETVERYDTHGNLVQMQKENGSRVSFKWSHDRTLPVAQVIDATTPYTANPGTSWVLSGETAFTGFESGIEDDHNGEEDFWSFQGVNFHVSSAHTGKMARRIIQGASQYGPIRELRPQNQNTRYVFSAWVKTPSNYAGGKLFFRSKLDDPNNTSTYPNPGTAPSYNEVSIPATNGQWQLVEVKLDLKAIRQAANLPQSVVLRIAASIQNNDPNNPLDIDDLRILPERARMTSYTYEPMVGQLATLDENNNASHFQYDALWRMESASDHNDFVRKQVGYEYAMNEVHVHSDAIENKANVGDLVNFTATTSIECSDGAIYTWDFGDGTVETGAAYRFHTYLNPGIYQVSLTVNSGGRSATTTSTLTILN